MRRDEEFALQALHHVQLAIPAGGEEACRQFWCDVLGMREVEKPPALAERGGCWFRSGALELHVGVQEEFAAATKAHPGLLVSGLDGLAGALERAGHEVVWDEEFPGHRRFYDEDPFGNRVEFLEPITPDAT